jgi:hypothetical protein
MRVKPDAGPDAETGDASLLGLLENCYPADGQKPGEFVSGKGTAGAFDCIGQRRN